MNRVILAGVAPLALGLLPPAEALDHGFAGDRFFPATIRLHFSRRAPRAHLHL